MRKEAERRRGGNNKLCRRKMQNGIFLPRRRLKDQIRGIHTHRGGKVLGGGGGGAEGWGVNKLCWRKKQNGIFLPRRRREDNQPCTQTGGKKKEEKKMQKERRANRKERTLKRKEKKKNTKKSLPHKKGGRWRGGGKRGVNGGPRDKNVYVRQHQIGSTDNTEDLRLESNRFPLLRTPQ